MVEYKKREIAVALPAGTNKIGIVMIGEDNGDIANVAGGLPDDLDPLKSVAVLGFNYGYDGTKWQRFRLDANKLLQVVNEHSLKGKTILYDTADATNTTTIIRTVTTGKTYYLLQAGLRYGASAGIRNCAIQLDNSANPLLMLTSHKTDTYYTYDTNSISVTYPHPIPIAAGTEIEVLSTGSELTADGWIVGWEE